MKKMFLIVSAALCILSWGCHSTGSGNFRNSLGKIDITIPSEGKDAELYVDGSFLTNVQEGVMALKLYQGTHDLKISANGYVPFERQVYISGPENKQILIVKFEKTGTAEK